MGFLTKILSLLKGNWPWALLFLAGCASVTIHHFDPLDGVYGPAAVKDRMVSVESPLGNHYDTQVKPIIENRCVVCHGCYDAPCQLKLTSPQGIDRGASKDSVYDGTRILALDPTRLGVDASSTFEWRLKDFHPVLNERTQTAEINQQASLIHRFLEQKQQHPLPEQKLLGSEFNLGTQRQDQCPTLEEFPQFTKDNPLAGMPYGLPALNSEEHETLSKWISNGSAMAKQAPLPTPYIKEIEKWEAYLNQSDLKHQLAARYIFEHTYLASLYFSDLSPKTKEGNVSPKEYFRLVRSSTPPGFAIDPIRTRRPNDDPGIKKVYYRLQRNSETILAKTHMPYELSNEKLAWMKSLFSNPDYSVTKLPSYEPEVAANPFVAFAQLPVVSRYRFMLEEAQFIIMGFIKGPVCRGQIALNVIDDHFWVFFTDPETQPKNLGKFLAEQSDNLAMPGESQSNAVIVANWVKLSLARNNYIKNKIAFDTEQQQGTPQGLENIWEGYGHNANAALTIFRHFDSSTVTKGLVGQAPKTAWVIDYPLLERIHYLLVADFDVFGNVGHQLNTRLYMDFLRMEGESNFLSLLPVEERNKLWQHWYRNSAQQVKDYVFGPNINLAQSTKIEYQSNEPKEELFSLLKRHLGKLADSKFNLSENEKVAALNNTPAKAASIMPEIGILSIESNSKSNEPLKLFTILRNSGHSNIDSLLLEDYNRLPEEDYLTVTSGISGPYPAAFWHIKENQIQEFIAQVNKLQSEKDYEALMDKFAIRRTHKEFWAHSDNVHQQFKLDEPLEAGLLDYNRLENR